MPNLSKSVTLFNLILFTFVQYWKSPISCLKLSLTFLILLLHDLLLLFLFFSESQSHPLKLVIFYDSVPSPFLYILCLAGCAIESHRTATPKHCVCVHVYGVYFSEMFASKLHTECPSISQCVFLKTRTFSYIIIQCSNSEN